LSVAWSGLHRRREVNLGSAAQRCVNYKRGCRSEHDFDGTKEFFDGPIQGAIDKVDPLGYYLAPFGYAMAR